MKTDDCADVIAELVMDEWESRADYEAELSGLKKLLSEALSRLTRPEESKHA